LRARAAAAGGGDAQALLGDWGAAFRTLSVDRWLAAPTREQERELRRTMASKLLTYPLTLACHLEWLSAAVAHPAPQAKAPSAKAPSSQPWQQRPVVAGYPLRIGVLGARAESSLPSLYWQQLGLLSGRKLHLAFFGPHATLPLGAPERLGEDDCRVDFTCRSALFHDAAAHAVPGHQQGLQQGQVQGQSQSQLHSHAALDAFVLFNSGVGHPKEGRLWDETIRTMKKKYSGKRALFTCFNANDLARDLQAAKAHGLAVEAVAETNPMRSLAEETYEKEKVVTNYAAFWVRL
jgi:hypothetical protein